MLGDTAIAVNPKDDRFKHLVGKFVTFQLLEEKLKLLKMIMLIQNMGTGALKITPAHDFNDYDVGQRNNLEIINIFTEAGKINENAPKNILDLIDLKLEKEF